MTKKTRILLASMIFDLGMGKNHMYEPIVNWYFDFKDEAKPIKILIKYAWMDKELSYPFNDRMKAIFIDGKVVSSTKVFFNECGYDYNGSMNIDVFNDYYLSPKGLEIGFVKDFKTACKLYQN